MAKTTIAPPTSKAMRSARKAEGGTKARLGPGQLEELVLGFMREHRARVPHTAGAIGKAIGCSSGAVTNCLIRLERAGEVRLLQVRPRTYDEDRVDVEQQDHDRRVEVAQRAEKERRLPGLDDCGEQEGGKRWPRAGKGGAGPPGQGQQ
jgi:DNA-binding MarR family transcriptional regulator